MYNVCGMKLEIIEVEKISTFLLHVTCLFFMNRYSVHDFCLLPVMFQDQSVDLFAEVYHIPTCCIHHSLDKHDFGA